MLDEIAAHQWRPELSIDDLPAPQRIAPYAAAMAAEVTSGDEEIGNGRLVLLHDPRGNESWQGTFRCVTYAKAEVESEMVTDPMLAEVGWTWLMDALADHSADFIAPSGTVTAVHSVSFGEMADEPGRAEVEIRASWTPLLAEDGSGISAHLSAWGDLLCTTAGIPSLPAGVVSLSSHLGSTR